ncbi:MAG: redoxin domain-containing protein [Verrucomicrobia bacterium]|nr:redoxin domain-containing protein [Verrucomicrobiota bacterium]
MIPNRLSIASRYLLAAVLCLAASTRVAAQSSTGYVETGDIAREFTLKNRKTGAPIQLSDYAGKIVVLDLFAYW